MREIRGDVFQGRFHNLLISKNSTFWVPQISRITFQVVYYNFCLPHASLRIPFALPEPTHGPGSAKRWQPRTPAMAAGLTDHVWTLREVLLFRVPPWPQPAQG
jgi:hypothetical protein